MKGVSKKAIFKVALISSTAMVSAAAAALCAMGYFVHVPPFGSLKEPDESELAGAEEGGHGDLAHA